MKPRIHLLVIDPQNDFCDLPANHLPSDPLSPGAYLQPQLAVPGAHADMLRLATMVNSAPKAFSEITVTLDSHHRVGIERPALWVNADGSEMQPFTQITAADVRSGRYLPRNLAHTARIVSYLDALEAAGRYVHMVWTPHCEIGTWGHCVHADLRAAYNTWEQRELGIVNKVFKGTNPWTEHFSAIQAEVPDAADPSTLLNRPLLANLAQADIVVIAGEAGSHCVRATTEHIVDNLVGVESKVVLLTDCISPVTGFETQYTEFLRDMAGRGVRLATTESIRPELAAYARR